MPVRAVPCFTLLLLLAATPLSAQLPGLPVLQNAFGNPGLSGAANAGGASGAASYVGAASYGVGRFILSGGAGAVVADTGGTGAAYGARVAMPFLSFMGGSFGVAGFVGAGGSSRRGVSAVQAPIGASIGWRHGIGATRGVSVYAAPMYSLYRASGGGVSTSKGLFRASVGADLAISRRLGVTIGTEGGANAALGEPGPAGTLWGVGVAWAFGVR